MPTTRPAFRLPWTSGAYAYPEADTFAAAREGFKRRRKSLIFHMTNDGEAGQVPCQVCGIALAEIGRDAKKVDLHSTWTYLPKQKAVAGGMHYLCSWSALMNMVLRIQH